MSPPQSCLIANSNFCPQFPSSIAGDVPFFMLLRGDDLFYFVLSGQETVAPASCIITSFADGSVMGYRLPLALASSGAWDKVQGSVLCLASDGNEILAIGLSSGHVMIFDRHDMRAVFCSQTAQMSPGTAVATPSRIQLHTSSSGGRNLRILLLARFTDGSLRLWRLAPCRVPDMSSCYNGVGILGCTEAPVMSTLQVVMLMRNLGGWK